VKLTGAGPGAGDGTGDGCAGELVATAVPLARGREASAPPQPDSTAAAHTATAAAATVSTRMVDDEYAPRRGGDAAGFNFNCASEGAG
jgi:hypothetical protein